MALSRSVQFNSSLLGMRTKRRRKELVTSDSFFRRHTAELAVELSCALGQEGRPHLQKAVRETRLEDVAGDCRELRLKANIRTLPELILAALKSPEGFWLLGAELHSPFGSEYFDKPGISFARGQSLHFKAKRNVSVFDSHICVQEGIVPGVAGRHAALPIRTLMINLLQLSVDPHRIPAEPKWDVHRVHAEIPHHTDLTAGLHLAFPIYGFVGIEIAAVVEA